jgi:glycerophosphoryl diester phosphodiesterase
MESAHQRGFRVRIYCVNGQTGPPLFSPYRFASPEAAATRWRAAAESGVDWVATDEYDAAAEALRPTH